METGHHPKVFYGWWIVAAAALQAFYLSGTFFQGFTAFFNPIVNEFGWSRAATATAMSLQRTEAGIIGPFVGILIDRYGARKMMLVGTVVIAAGFFLLARIQSLLGFYIAIGTIALGLSLGAMVATTAVVGNWFLRRRGRAFTIAFAGGGLGGTVAPLLVWAIGAYGWRPVLDWIAVGTLLVGIPVAMVMRHRPEPYGYLPDGREPEAVRQSSAAPQGVNPSMEAATRSGDGNQVSGQEIDLSVREMLKTPAFWLLVMSMGVGGMVMSTLGLFSIPGLESFGISSSVAGLTVFFISIFNLTGRFSLGFLADVVDKRYVLAGTYLLMALGSLAFASIHQGWQIMLFLVLYPPGHGGTVPVRFALLADYFGRKSFASLVGLTMTLTAIFGIIGPVFTGWMFDVTGSYRWPFIIIGVLVLPAVPITLMAKRPGVQ